MVSVRTLVDRDARRCAGDWRQTGPSFTSMPQRGDLVEWMASRVNFRLVTGDHDARAVSPSRSWDSGLQSLLRI